MCERKATFILAISRLGHMSQTVLKGMVEHAMQVGALYELMSALYDLMMA